MIGVLVFSLFPKYILMLYYQMGFLNILHTLFYEFCPNDLSPGVGRLESLHQLLFQRERGMSTETQPKVLANVFFCTQAIYLFIC